MALLSWCKKNYNSQFVFYDAFFTMVATESKVKLLYDSESGVG